MCLVGNTVRKTNDSIHPLCVLLLSDSSQAAKLPLERASFGVWCVLWSLVCQLATHTHAEGERKGPLGCSCGVVRSGWASWWERRVNVVVVGEGEC